jgi:hypothetical protein
VPVYVHLGGKQIATRPLVFEGRTARAELIVPSKPKDVTLNDYYEALVELNRN